MSRDPEETYLYMVDGVNEQVRVVLRSTLEVLTTFGDGGRQPGQFFGIHNIATDSMGNIYTTETYTRARVQRFLYRGLPVSAADQGVPWPEQSDENTIRLAGHGDRAKVRSGSAAPDRPSRQLEAYPPVRLPSSRISSASLCTRPASPPNRLETFAE